VSCTKAIFKAHFLKSSIVKPPSGGFLIQSIHFKSNPLYAVEPSNTPNSASNKVWQKQKVFTAVNNVALTIQNGRVNVLNVENGIV
jgi:hypothetical protein